MDVNKLKVLKGIEYNLQECCGICSFGSFPGRTDFGVCLHHTYQHQKHSLVNRSLSIYRYGMCHTGSFIKRDDTEADHFFSYL